mgnify:FL=1
MAGGKCMKEKLNNTLLRIVSLLNKNDITRWFVSYGTLLGMIREESCIGDDDDIDIIIHHSYYDKIKKILEDNGFKEFTGWGCGKRRHIYKTVGCENYCTIDFYMVSTRTIRPYTGPPNAPGILDNGIKDCPIVDVNTFVGEIDFHDHWNHVVWTNCYDSIDPKSRQFIKKEWKGEIINIPNNYEQKLVNRYGDWKTPKQTKGGGESRHHL